jgi:hypothetical protein
MSEVTGMTDRVRDTLVLIDDRLAKLEALMKEGPADVIAERFRTWKEGTAAFLRETVTDAVAKRFAAPRPVRLMPAYGGHRPPPPFLGDAAEARAFLVAIRRDIETDPSAVLRSAVPAEVVAPARTPDTLRIVNLLERKWRKAVRTKPETEKEVQDAFETLLVGADIPYLRETDSIVYSSKTYTPDFSFPDLRLAVELKLCNRPGREKEIIAEINDDILAYRQQYPQNLFGVYDLGLIRDIDRFAETFEGHEGVVVRVVKQ